MRNMELYSVRFDVKSISFDFKEVFRKILHRKYRLGLIKNAAIQKKVAVKRKSF